MTTEDQLHAVRLAMGYTCISRTINVTFDDQPIRFQLWRSPTGGGMERDVPPDYLNDLNACHEMERSLTKDQLYNYGNQLDRITLPNKSMEMAYVANPEAGMYPELFRATAIQRCEAFLKTLCLWQS